jgi:GNAT superfamily N-acetyltransferase
MVDRGFVGARTAVLALRDGGRIRIRPIVPEDRELIRWGFDHLSDESRYRRFMGLKRLSEHDLDYLTNIDYTIHFAWVAFAHDVHHEPGIGVARYVRDKTNPEEAEAAVAVLDEYHKRGIGTLLLEALAAVALENGIRRFVGYVLVDNTPMKDLLHTLGAKLATDSPGVERMTLELPQQLDELKGTPLYRVLRAVARGEAPPPSGPMTQRPAVDEKR